MIRTRSLVAAALAFVGIVAVIGPAAPRPEVSLAADALVLARAEAADATLATLQDALDMALDAGRDGAAAVIAGDEPPGPRMRDAAELTREASSVAVDAAASIAALDGALAARDRAAELVPVGTSSADLGSISAQLDAVAEPADEFATMRRWAAAVPVALDAALAALRNGDLSEAEAQVAVARRAHDAIAGWDVDYVTLPIWIETSDATIDLVEEMIAAVSAGRGAEARRLADEFAALADDAVIADRALQIAISEDGGTLAAAPLSRLVDARRAVDEQRAAVANLIAEERRGDSRDARPRPVYSVAVVAQPT